MAGDDLHHCLLRTPIYLILIPVSGISLFDLASGIYNYQVKSYNLKNKKIVTLFLDVAAFVPTSKRCC